MSNCVLKLFSVVFSTCRCEWKWAEDRASVASRWTWLQAQVSDLEYRIRQQNDIYRQIRNSKGSISLGQQTPPKDMFVTNPVHKGKKVLPLGHVSVNNEVTSKSTDMSPAQISTMLGNIDKQSNRLTQQFGDMISPQSSPAVAAGAVSSSSSTAADSTSVKPGTTSTLTFDPVSPVLDQSCQAARCRPIKGYRKRKLLRSTGIHYFSRKAAKLSTVHCQCYPPVTPCAMCGGRYNKVTAMRADSLPLTERLALVDQTFHPVLSFRQGE